MAQLINEAKRMQFLAGLITESQLNEENITMDYYDKEKKANIPGTFNLIKIKFGNIDTGVPKKEDYHNDGTLPVFIGTDKPCERCNNNSIDKNKLTIGAYIDKEGNLVKKGGVLNGMSLVDFDSSSNDAVKSILSSIKDTSGLQKYIKDEYSKLKPSSEPQAESQLNEGIKTIDANSRDFKVEGNEEINPADLKPGTMITKIRSYHDKAELESEAGKFEKVENDYIYWKTKDGQEKSWRAAYTADLALVKNLEMAESQKESVNINSVVNEALAKARRSRK